MPWKKDSRTNNKDSIIQPEISPYLSFEEREHYMGLKFWERGPLVMIKYRRDKRSAKFITPTVGKFYLELLKRYGLMELFSFQQVKRDFPDYSQKKLAHFLLRPLWQLGYIEKYAQGEMAYHRRGMWKFSDESRGKYFGVYYRCTQKEINIVEGTKL